MCQAYPAGMNEASPGAPTHLHGIAHLSVQGRKGGCRGAFRKNLSPVRNARWLPRPVTGEMPLHMQLTRLGLQAPSWEM